MTLLTVKNLSITAESELVKHISFDVKKSEIVAIVGESGSGKTLTALGIMGLLPAGLAPTGEIRFGGRGTRNEDNKKNLALRGKDIAMIFQEPMTSLNPLHTIGKQIGEAVQIHHPEMSKSHIRERVLELLGQVGLEHFKDRLNAWPHQLSGGERQRVMIAMAIANDPALLVADEPTTALDVTIQAQILALLKSLQQKTGMSVLLITHDLTLVRRIADRVIIMSQGEIVESGNTADIFKSPTHAYTQKLLASEPKTSPAPAPANAKMLMRCKDLSVAFPVGDKLLGRQKVYKTVLEHISLSVAQGSTLGIVGESGSGKTSLALALLRLTASTGSIEFEGARIDTLTGKHLRELRKHMQIVFQDPYGSLNPRMNIGSIVREGLDVHDTIDSDSVKEARVDLILKEVGLTPDMKERYPHEFSGGQRQRISIARALILKPRLIILDEPTSALDMTVQLQILDLLKSLQQKYGLAYIFISHDLRTVRAISHHILVLQKGRVVESGAAGQIFTAPKQAYTKALLAAAMGSISSSNSG